MDFHKRECRTGTYACSMYLFLILDKFELNKVKYKSFFCCRLFSWWWCSSDLGEAAVEKQLESARVKLLK